MITSARDGHCVEHAISLMRAALGYNTGFPEDYPKVDNKREWDVVHLFRKSFPDRCIKVWCPVSYWERIYSDVEYEGTRYDPEPKWDNWLFTFTYTNGEGKGHIVVGWPTAYGDMDITLVIAVEM